MAETAVDFYCGVTRDHRRRSLEDILRWSDDRLESTHDYIQWLFPLPDPSPVNPYAPLLTPKAIREFRARPDLQALLRESLERMLRFYGLELRDFPVEVLPAENFLERARSWLHPGNHNHLRITRIVRCCALAGLEAEARAFLDALLGIAHVEETKPDPGITPETLDYWIKAVG